MTTLEIILTSILYVIVGIITGAKISTSEGEFGESPFFVLLGASLWPVVWVIRIIQTVIIDTWDW